MGAEQLAIEFGEAHKARAAWETMIGHCREIADSATVKELAYRADVSPSSMTAALACRDRHYFRAEWIPIFLAAATDAQRLELLAALAGTVGYQVTRAKTLTTAERLALLEDKVRRELGSVGERLIAEVAR